MLIKNMKSHLLHQRFKFHFDEYEPKDVMLICNKIQKQLKLKGKNSYQAVVGNWGETCLFLIKWTGRNKNDKNTYDEI